MNEVIYSKKCNGVTHQVEPLVESAHDDGCYLYRLSATDDEGLGHSNTIEFQHGPVTESGINGLQSEHLLAVLIHRLRCFQSGDFACRENDIAITKLQEALMWLEHRTKSRIDRGVEGTSQR